MHVGGKGTREREASSSLLVNAHPPQRAASTGSPLARREQPPFSHRGQPALWCSPMGYYKATLRPQPSMCSHAHSHSHLTLTLTLTLTVRPEPPVWRREAGLKQFVRLSGFHPHARKLPPPLPATPCAFLGAHDCFRTVTWNRPLCLGWNPPRGRPRYLWPAKEARGREVPVPSQGDGAREGGRKVTGSPGILWAS